MIFAEVGSTGALQIELNDEWFRQVVYFTHSMPVGLDMIVKMDHHLSKVKLEETEEKLRRMSSCSRPLTDLRVF
jgi:hypothetical protein